MIPILNTLMLFWKKNKNLLKQLVDGHNNTFGQRLVRSKKDS